VAAKASTFIGGGPGRRARVGTHWWWTPMRVLLAFMYTRMCYSDVEALYFAEGLNEGAQPYYDHPVEYPVVVGAVMGLAAKLASGLPGGDRPEGFFDITVLLLALCGLSALVCTVKLARRRPWDAALLAFAPAFVLHAYTNWDLVAVALTALGMLAWARRAPVLAGVLLGLGISSKLYPVLLLVPLLALCWRAGRLRTWLVAAAATVGCWVVVNVPVILTANSFTEQEGRFSQVTSGGDNAWLRFWQLNQDRVADHDTLWHWVEQMLDGGGGFATGVLTVTGAALVLALVLAVLLGSLAVAVRLPVWLAALGAVVAVGFVGVNVPRLVDLVQAMNGHDAGVGFGFPVDPLNAAVAMATVAVLLGVVVLAIYAPVRPRWPQLAFLALAGFLLVNKVYSPQYVIWLIPLAVLARPRWPAFLVWQTTECLVFLTRFLYLIRLGAANKGIAYGWFGAAVWLRDIALVSLMALVVREVLRPELDVVRRDGDDDPAGGVLDGAPDRVVPADVRARQPAGAPA
jgi:hypothetical protein